MSKIKSIKAHEVLDSRGNPTVEVFVATSKNCGGAIVPSGASTGTHEALELRDLDPKRYRGKGVLKAVANVNEVIEPKLCGVSVFDQKKIDQTLISIDGTANKSRLGTNAILGVSLACARVAALEQKKYLFQYLNPKSDLLPTPLMNVINGGQHADSGLDIQEFMIVPHGAKTFREALRMGAEIFHALSDLLKEKGFSTAVGDEGGFAPKLGSHEKALDFLLHAIERTAFKPGKDVSLALDCAASEFYEKNHYTLKINGKPEKVSGKELVGYYESLIKKYPIITIEDGLAEDDWDSWRYMTFRVGKKIQIVGDDLFVTSRGRLKFGIDKGVANAILIKLNQIGTLTETLEVIEMAKKNRYRTIISHRSGETEDTFIADLAVATEAGQIKTGSLCRSERIAKYNQLLRIANVLGPKAKFRG